MLIKINIIKSKQIMLNFSEKIMIILNCNNIKIPIIFHRKKTLINQTMKAIAQVIVSIKKLWRYQFELKNQKFRKTEIIVFIQKRKKC